MDELVPDILKLLESFDGQESLKRLFWETLSYDRVREPLPISILPPSAADYVTSLEVFASTEAATLVIANLTLVADGGRLEQMTWALKRKVPNCVVLLHHEPNWSLIYPDEALKPRVRILPLPGPTDRREEIVRALVALNAADEASGKELTALELAQSLDASFPGVTPNIADLLTDFERIAQHAESETQELLWFVRQAGRYPLLTPAQERGEDLRGDEEAPDGADLNYHQWRLVVHNLRLVVWLARQWRGRGVELVDLVQEGTLGLMVAARRYDPDRGTRFTTFAYWWVLQGITCAIYNGCNLIRWPVYKAPQLLKAAREERTEGLSAGEQDPLRVPLLCIPQWGECHPFDLALTEETRAAVRNVLSGFKPRQRVVIERRFGIADGDEETLEQIGQDLGCTRERVRQIEAKVLKRLRKHRMADHLKPYLDSTEWRLHHSPECLNPYDAGHPFGLSAGETITLQLNLCPEVPDTASSHLPTTAAGKRVTQDLDDLEDPTEPVTEEEMAETRAILGIL